LFYKVFNTEHVNNTRLTIRQFPLIKMGKLGIEPKFNICKLFAANVQMLLYLPLRILR